CTLARGVLGAGSIPAHLMRQQKGGDAVRIAASGPFNCFVTRCQRSTLNNDYPQPTSQPRLAPGSARCVSIATATATATAKRRVGYIRKESLRTQGTAEQGIGGGVGSGHRGHAPRVPTRRDVARVGSQTTADTGVGATNACCASGKACMLARGVPGAGFIPARLTRQQKGRDAVRIAASGPFNCFVTRCQRNTLNNDICCICENRVWAACSAVLSSWYWLIASA
ncbi:MAG: hypothetical protein ACN6RD_13440, partial [Stenotrophomonas maltophilia]